MDSLPGVMWHLSDAWARRGEPNVVLVHYFNDLSTDLLTVSQRSRDKEPMSPQIPLMQRGSGSCEKVLVPEHM